MKFWNKRHRVRQKHWHRFELKTRPVTTATGQTSAPLLSAYLNNYRGWLRRSGFFGIKRYLQSVDSPGRFYMTIMIKEIWFEREEDLTMFALTYSGEKDVD